VLLPHSPDRCSFQRWQRVDQRICGAGNVRRRLGTCLQFSLSRARTLGSVSSNSGDIFLPWLFVAFGIQHFVLRAFSQRDWVRPGFWGDRFGRISPGSVFVAAGAAIFPGKNGAIGGYSPGNDPFFCSFLLFYIPRIAAQTAQSGPRGPVDLRFLGLCGGAMVLAKNRTKSREQVGLRSALREERGSAHFMLSFRQRGAT